MKLFYHTGYHLLWLNLLNEKGKSIIPQVSEIDLSTIEAEEVFATSENIPIDLRGYAIRIFANNDNDLAILYPYDIYMWEYGYQVVWYSLDGFDYKSVEVMQESKPSCPRTYFLVQDSGARWTLCEFIITKYRFPHPSSTIRTIISASSREDVIRDSGIDFNSLKCLYSSKGCANAEGKPSTPAHLTKLAPNEIFVFGSNKEGRHGGGAATDAARYFGAQWGVGVGRTGQSYAIPTMDGSLDLIAEYVEGFRCYAVCHPELTFYVTPIGCGIAGWKEEQIAPLFSFAHTMANVILPQGW